MSRASIISKPGEPAKDYLPITWCDLGGKGFGWRSKGFPEPRPLYNLPALVTRPDAMVIVAEGEKSADAAAILFPDMVATTPPHGAKSPHKADWSALKGRVVIVATDHDEAGRQFGDKLRKIAREVGVASLRILPPERLGAWIWRDGQKIRRDGPIPKGWDIADALAEGWTAEALAEDLRLDPDFLSKPKGEEKAPEDAPSWPFRLVASGVEKRIERTAKDTGAVSIEWKWFCSRLEIIAETRSTVGEEWGRLLRIADRDGRVKEWSMPMSMLAGDGTAYRERLLSLGLILAPGRFARDALHEYISTARPGVKARCVARLGWGDGAFIFPNHSIEGGDHG